MGAKPPSGAPNIGNPGDVDETRHPAGFSYDVAQKGLFGC